MKTHSANKHESKTMWVVVLTAVTMIVEIIFGITCRSMNQPDSNL